MTQDDTGAAFPQPEWPPIQNLENVDIAGQRKDGGVDLFIVASQPLDDSVETLDSIRRKVANYLDVIDLPEFQADMGHPPRDKITVTICCDFPIHPRAAEVIAECEREAARRGVRLTVGKQPG